MRFHKSIQSFFALIALFSLCVFSSSLSSCSSDSSDASGRAVSLYRSKNMGKSDTTDAGKSFTLNYNFGSYSGRYNNIYVIWAENSERSFYYPVYVCEKLLDGSLTGTALPYWKVNKYPKMNSSEVDAVSQATIKKQDFSISFKVPFDAPNEFTIYFETDVSFNGNDWFHQDQPATLYKADIDLKNLKSQYYLEFVGWTPDEITVLNEKKYNDITSVELVLGGLQDDTRYITEHKVSTFPDTFGDPDDNPQTNLVDRIVVTTTVTE